MTFFSVLCMAALLASPAANSATDIYIFDTVTALELSKTKHQLSGIEKDTGSPLNVRIETNTADYLISRCVPIFLTALEKPGRYYLYLRIDPNTTAQLKGCRLELKS